MLGGMWWYFKTFFIKLWWTSQAFFRSKSITTSCCCLFLAYFKILVSNSVCSVVQCLKYGLFTGPAISLEKQKSLFNKNQLWVLGKLKLKQAQWALFILHFKSYENTLFWCLSWTSSHLVSHFYQILSCIIIKISTILKF